MIYNVYVCDICGKHSDKEKRFYGHRGYTVNYLGKKINIYSVFHVEGCWGSEKGDETTICPDCMNELVKLQAWLYEAKSGSWFTSGSPL